MTSVHDLVLELGDALPVAVADPGSRTGVGVMDVELDVPVEWRIDAGGELTGTLPRGRLATGFDPPLGRMRMRFVRQGA